MTKLLYKLLVDDEDGELRFFLKLVCFFVFTSFVSLPTFAQTNSPVQLLATPWHEIEGGRVRVALNNGKEGKHFEGIIEVDLKPGWKTYWQNPGSSGMAPEFDFQPSLNHQILFPVPQLFIDGNDWSIGYKGEVMLPFYVEKDTKNAAFKGQFTLGLCKEICIPVNIPFDFSDASDKTPLPNSLLAWATDKLPKSKPQNLEISAREDGQLITITLENIDGETIKAIFLDGNAEEIGPAEIVKKTAHEMVFSARIISRNSNDPLRITYIVDGEPIAFTGTLVVDKKN